MFLLFENTNFNIHGGTIVKKLVIAVLFVCLIMFSLPKYLQYKNTSNQINAYLDENNYQQDILSKDMDYDYKLGYFYMVVYYEDYPDREYNYFRYNGSIDSIAFENGVQIEVSDYVEGVTHEGEF